MSDLTNRERPLIAAIRDMIRLAIEAERERWQPAVTYFERYCQDEAAEDAMDHNGCSEQQHEDAKAFAAVVRGDAA